MSLDNIAAHNLAGSDTAVVRTLRTWETALWPSVWPPVGVEESVLLFQTEPEFVLLVCLHDDGCVVSEVEAVRFTIRHPAFTHDENIVA